MSEEGLERSERGILYSQGQLDSLSKQKEQTKQKLMRLETDIASYEQAVQAKLQEISGIESRLDNTTRTIREQEAGLSNLQKEKQALEASLLQIEEQTREVVEQDNTLALMMQEARIGEGAEMLGDTVYGGSDL
jgi:chromosome segregation ATPase